MSKQPWWTIKGTDPWVTTTHKRSNRKTGIFLAVCMYKHRFLPVLLVFVIKCVKMYFSLPHDPYRCLLPSPVCLHHLLICTCINSSPIACPPSSVLLRWCILCFVILFSFFSCFLFGTDSPHAVLSHYRISDAVITSYPIKCFPVGILFTKVTTFIDQHDQLLHYPILFSEVFKNWTPQSNNSWFLISPMRLDWFLNKYQVLLSPAIQ